MKIIALDGISNAGKTTMCNLNKEDCYIVPEPHFVTEYNFDLTFEKNNIIKNSKITLELEKLRNEHIKSYSTKKTMIIDRSILSYIAISYSYKKSGIDYFSEFTNVVIKMLEKDEITIPDVIVILKRDFKECQILLNQKNLPEYWCSENFASLQQSVFDKFAKKFNNYAVEIEEPCNINQIDLSNKTKITKSEFIEFLKELEQ